MFEQLEAQAATDQLKQFAKYIAETWIDSPLALLLERFPDDCKKPTNNDMEGWHNGLNHCASAKWSMPFYLLLDLLHQEVQLMALQICLVSKKR